MNKVRVRALLILGVVTVGGLLAVTAWYAVAEERPQTHTSQWQWLHGREAVRDLTTCNACHDWHSCQTCHLAEWPHDENWQAAHGDEALRLEGRGCYLCHRESYCNPCHGGVRMPHPDDFMSAHPDSGYTEQSCQVCHVQRECDVCHQEHEAHTAGGVNRP